MDIGKTWAQNFEMLGKITNGWAFVLPKICTPSPHPPPPPKKKHLCGLDTVLVIKDLVLLDWNSDPSRHWSKGGGWALGEGG